MPTDMEKTDAQWLAEGDARTLAEAKLINDDPGRRESAEQAAARLAEEKRDEATAMSSVARDKLRQRFPNSPGLFKDRR